MSMDNYKYFTGGEGLEEIPVMNNNSGSNGLLKKKKDKKKKRKAEENGNGEETSPKKIKTGQPDSK